MTGRKLGGIIRRLAAQAWLNSKVFWLVELVAFAVFFWIYSRDYRNDQSTTVSSWFSDPAGLSPIFGTSFGMAALFGAALEVGLTMVLLVPMIRDWLVEKERQKIEELSQAIEERDQMLEERDQAIEELRRENEMLRQEPRNNGSSEDSD